MIRIPLQLATGDYPSMISILCWTSFLNFNIGSNKSFFRIHPYTTLIGLWVRGIPDCRILTNSLSGYRSTCLRCSEFRIHELVVETEICRGYLPSDQCPQIVFPWLWSSIDGWPIDGQSGTLVVVVWCCNSVRLKNTSPRTARVTSHRKLLFPPVLSWVVPFFGSRLAFYPCGFSVHVCDMTVWLH